MVQFSSLLWQFRTYYKIGMSSRRKSGGSSVLLKIFGAHCGKNEGDCLPGYDDVQYCIKARTFKKKLLGSVFE